MRWKTVNALYVGRQNHRVLFYIPLNFIDQVQLPSQPLHLPYAQTEREEGYKNHQKVDRPQEGSTLGDRERSRGGVVSIVYSWGGSTGSLQVYGASCGGMRGPQRR